MDAGDLRPRRRRRADAEGAGELRRVGVGVLLAAGHRAAGWSSPPPASTAIRRARWNWCGSSG
ncbi:hypothetical protein ACPA9J_18945 [Pseudomonas aeruginosa]